MPKLLGPGFLLCGAADPARCSGTLRCAQWEGRIRPYPAIGDPRLPPDVRSVGVISTINNPKLIRFLLSPRHPTRPAPASARSTVADLALVQRATRLRGAQGSACHLHTPGEIQGAMTPKADELLGLQTRRAATIRVFVRVRPTAHAQTPAMRSRASALVERPCI